MFGLGSRTPIAITVLLKNPDHTGKALIQYHDIGDYLTREQKLEIVKQKGSVLNLGFKWQRITPDEHGDWLNQRNDTFASFVPMGDKDNKTNKVTWFLPVYSNGLKTQRDAWCWNFSKAKVGRNIKATIDYFNQILGAGDISIDSTRISWSRGFGQDLARGRKKTFDASNIINGHYRPFCRQEIYYSAQLNEVVGQVAHLFPIKVIDNLAICVSGIGSSKGFSCLISKQIPDIQLQFNGQCFPFYYYEPKKSTAPQLPGLTTDTAYERKDAITDFIHGECKALYGQNVTKEDIFYYIYGLLHSPEYRKTFANDLKKSLPRLPLVDKPETFQAFSKAGRALANLHLNYEEQPPCPDVLVEGVESGNFRVEKMRFVSKGDKSAIQYNESIRLSNIPLDAYDYVVNGRSAIEWIMDRYQVRVDKASGIVNDPNDWATEHNKPRYILDLLLSIVTVSLETNRIVRGLPKLTF